MASITEVLREYKTFFDDLKGDNHFYRLGKPFKTSKEYYFYDLGTGKIFCINENIYTVLRCLFDTNEFDSLLKLGLDTEILKSTLEEIKESVLKENILSAPIITCFSGPQSLSLSENLEHNMSQLILETTQRCNLRCEYCIYQDDHNDYHSFNNIDMTFDTAKKSIDFTYQRANDKMSIGFYGGEPLLNFKLIKQCVDYAENLIKDKRLNFVMTTNAVLITEDIAKYFAKHNFIITVSLDGPKEIHDENRKFQDGTGSFEYTIRGLKFLVDAYKDRAEYSLFISMVTDGPNIKEKYDKIQSFFDNTEWLPNLSVNSSYISQGRLKQKYTLPSNQNDKLYSNNLHIDPLSDWSIEKQDGQFNKKKLFSNRKIREGLHVIHRRDLYNEPMQNYYFNGCCIPGSRRLYVTVDGNFSPCERVGTTPFLGNVNSGFDMESIKKYYVNDFMNEAVKYCNNCWAAHLCTNCYVGCFDTDKVNFSYRHSSCNYMRYTLEKYLILYHEILERDPESLDKLNDIVLE